MNGYVVLSLVLMLIGALVGYFFIVGTTAIKAVVMFGATGAVISACFFIVTMKKMYKTFYPLNVRVYGDRYDAFSIKDSTRGKVIKDKKGLEYIETVGGKRYKMPPRKWIVKGDDKFVDLFDTDDQQFPIKINRDNIEAVYKEVIPENQRVFFAERVVPTVTEATKPPKSDLLYLAQLVVPMGLCVMLIVGMILAPDYWAKSWEFWGQKVSAIQAQQEEFLKTISQAPILVSCENGQATIEKPKPPPG